MLAYRWRGLVPTDRTPCPPHGLSSTPRLLVPADRHSRVRPRAPVVRVQRLRLRPPWPHVRHRGAGVQAPLGVGVHPSCPLRPGKAAGMSKVRLWPPHPTPTSWGEQAPYHPGSQAHPALALVSCPLDTVQQPAACVGVGAWRAPCEGRKGQEAPLPNPRRPPPTASASLERAARARAGAGEEDGLCWSQAEARARPWRSSVRPGLRAAGLSQQALLERQSGCQ